VKSDIGLVRKTNEDSFAFSPPHLYIVADGMGGHVAGEIASSMAVKTVSEYVGQYAGTDDIKVVLEQAIIAANTVIYQSAQTNPQYCGMGTTIDVAYIIQAPILWNDHLLSVACNLTVSNIFDYHQHEPS
jgi:protein phosphatase